MAVRRLPAVVALALVVLVGSAAPAAAHASLESTDPAAGAVLDGSPDAISLRFSEPVEVQAGAVRVFDGRGERVDDGAVERDGTTVRLPVDLDDGGYVVTYRVVSVDGHPISGGFTFRVGQQAEEVQQSLFEELLAGQGADTALGVAAAVLRLVAFAALVVLLGGAALVAVLWPAGAADARHHARSPRPRRRAASRNAAGTSSSSRASESSP